MTDMDNLKNAGTIDLDSALERVGGDESFLRELLDIYVEDFIEKYPQLELAISQGNFNSIKEIGHSIKGASGNLSLNGLQDTAYAIELSGRENDIEAAKLHFARLRAEFKKLKDFLPPEKRRSIEQKIPHLE